jgi:hypothetical protein
MWNQGLQRLKSTEFFEGITFDMSDRVSEKFKCIQSIAWTSNLAAPPEKHIPSHSPLPRTLVEITQTGRRKIMFECSLHTEVTPHLTDAALYEGYNWSSG